MIHYIRQLTIVKEVLMKDLTKGNIYKTFILFAIPLVLAGILSQGYSLIDTVIAGKFLGADGLAAIGATSAFISFSSSIFWGYAAGSSIHTAALFGAKKYKEIKSAVYHNLISLVVAAIAFGIIVVLCDDFILRLLCVDEAIYSDAKLYLDIYIIGFFLMLLSNNCVHIMNAFGLSSYPFFMSLLSAVLNIGGNIFSVAVLKLGVAGIAFSTLFSALAVDICYMFKIRKCFLEMGVLKDKVSFNPGLLKKISIYGMPVAMQQLIMYVAGLMISPMVNGIGSEASAAYTVVMQIYNINASVYQNSAKTLSNYTAQCVGAGKTNQLKKGVRVGLLQGIVFLSLPLLICCIWAKPVCALFFPEGYTGEGLDYAILYARVYLPFIVFNLVNNLFHAFYRGTASMKLLLLLTGAGAASRIVFSMLFVQWYGMQGVYIGWVLSWITESILAGISYFSDRWKKTLPKTS